MTQETFPELPAPAEALEKPINLTVTQVTQVRQSFNRKRTILGSRREALPAFTLREGPEKLLAVREKGIPFRLARPLAQNRHPDGRSWEIARTVVGNIK